ncbi:MAG: hypothetical protein JW743_07270 [Deltaproteobacteria bacterium]|nr:hypothetical protein [Deltaproteobacteria bacterium]
MIEKRNGFLKSSTPQWQRKFAIFCGIAMILLCGYYIAQVYSANQWSHQLLKALLLFGIVLLILGSYAKTLFYTVSATERGLETDNIIGVPQLLLWDDIIAIRRPRFGFPLNHTYVISKNGDKLLLIKSNDRYKELAEYIRENAPNLEETI